MERRALGVTMLAVRSVILAAVLLAVLGAAGCATRNVRSLKELSALMAAEEYRVSAGDTLMVNVWGEQRLSGEVLVREDGRFTLPLINDVPAEGKTLSELSAEVTERLTAFIPAASVSIAVVQSAPIRYFLLGNFEKPGEYRSDKRITFLQAIATGNGFGEFANDSAVVLRRRGADGQEINYVLDYNRVVDGQEPNPELKNGDVIVVKD